jgi:NAD(P)-dependent dehydrogenase (short-subunit alcohol dehydrogenase family)
VVLQRDAISLEGRVAIVTGAGSGIGRGIANGLAAFGARVAVWERDEATCTAAATEVRGLPCPIDVRDEVQVDHALARTIDELGVPTILVNNAGGVFHAPLLEANTKAWDVLIRSNLTHLLLCTQRVARAMVRAEQPGSIVNISSSEGARAAPGFAAYAAAKAGVISLTRTAALELAPHRIRVNCLAPDIIHTEGVVRMVGEEPELQHDRIVPWGRAGHVDEMAGAAVFLASDLASYVTGQTLHVDGGTDAARGWYRHPEDGHYILGPIR